LNLPPHDTAGLAAVTAESELLVEQTMNGLRSRNIDVLRASTAAQAVQAVLTAVVPPARVITGGSRTISELGLPAMLRQTPGIKYVNDAIRAINDSVVRHEFRRAATAADYVIGSANALVTDGRIVNVDGGGSRISSYAFAAAKVIMIVSTSKICTSLDAAVDRVRWAAARRVEEQGPHREAAPPCAADGICREGQCRPPARECGKMLIIEKESIAGRILVVLVDEVLGF
jgi:L-lactate utilization protein LutC